MIINNYNANYPVSINFSGHAGCENIITKIGMRKNVTTETRFFRDYKTLKYATNYIREVFRSLKEKYFVVGACSTGEDVYSLKMLMGKEPLKITGFDIGKETVKDAKSGIFSLYFPVESKTKYRIDDLSTYEDAYLGFDKTDLTPEQKKKKKIFSEHFECIETKDSLKYKIKERLRKIFDVTYVEFDKLRFKYKKTGEDFEFKTADIRDFRGMLPERKCQLFAFKNSFYHIVTDNNYCIRQQLPREWIKPMLDKIFKNINKSLDKKGLFIMGENEHNQKSDIFIIGKSLLDNGFLPIRMPDRPYQNIWVKVKEVD